MQTETGAVALVAGAGGLVGAQLVHALVYGGEYRRVVALSRRPLPIESPRLVNRILRFENIESELRGVVCDDAYCCLGTTRRAAGSPQAFRAVDHDLVLRFARFAQSAGAKTLVVVSSAGAAPESRNFYLRVKGETELALEALRFRSLHLMQPSLLLGRARAVAGDGGAGARVHAAVQSVPVRALRALAGDSGAHRRGGDAGGGTLGAPRCTSPHLALTADSGAGRAVQRTTVTRFAVGSA